MDDATRARLEQPTRLGTTTQGTEEERSYLLVLVRDADLRALLVAYDAQAQELAAARPIVQAAEAVADAAPGNFQLWQALVKAVDAARAAGEGA